MILDLHQAGMRFSLQLPHCYCKKGLAPFDGYLPTRSSFPPVYTVMEAISLSSRPRTLFTSISYLVAGCRWWRMYSVASLGMAVLSVFPVGTEPRALVSWLVLSLG